MKPISVNLIFFFCQCNSIKMNDAAEFEGFGRLHDGVCWSLFLFACFYGF